MDNVTSGIYRYYSKPAEANRVSVVGQFVDNELRLSVSRCSKRDAFVRKKGRMIAENRLNNGIYFRVIPIQEVNTETFLKHAQIIAKEAANHPESVSNVAKKTVFQKIENTTFAVMKTLLKKAGYKIEKV